MNKVHFKSIVKGIVSKEDFQKNGQLLETIAPSNYEEYLMCIKTGLTIEIALNVLNELMKFAIRAPLLFGDVPALIPMISNAITSHKGPIM